MFHVKPPNKSPYLYFKLRSLFLHGSVYSRCKFCVERSLYSLRAKNGHYLDIRIYKINPLNIND